MTEQGPDRAPPMDMEAEQATLGAMMMARRACVAALGIVSREDFYSIYHQHIFQAIADLRDEGEVVDVMTVNALLKRREQSADAGGKEYLKRLLGEGAGLAHVTTHASIVHNLARLRRFVATCYAGAAEAYDHEGKPEELVRRCLNQLQVIAGDCNEDRTAQHTRVNAQRLSERIQRQRSRGEQISIARFGLPWIDKQLNGLAEWGMIVARGETKIGKSLLAGNAVMATCRAGGPVLAYVLEAVEEWEERCIAWLAKIDKRKLEGRKPMSKAEEQREADALAEWEELPLYYTGRLSHIDEICLDIEQQIMKGLDPALIVVDHFQRVVGEGKTATLRYDDAAQKLAQVPREHKCPLLVPSQISINNGVRQSMWCRRLDQEATVVFDITGEPDEAERALKPTLPRKFVPFERAKYYVGTNFDARLWDKPTWDMMSGGRRG